MAVPRNDPGLCGRCRHVREVVSDRGNRFYLCRRSETDPRFPKYPMVPVRQCVGYEPADPHPRPAP